MDNPILILILVGVIIVAGVIFLRSRETGVSGSEKNRTRPPTFGDEPSTVELPRPVLPGTPRPPATPPAAAEPEPQPSMEVPIVEDTEKEARPPATEQPNGEIPPPQPAPS